MRLTPFVLLVPLCLLALGARPARAELSADEAAMAAWIDGHAAEVESLIERLVNVNSGTLNHAGVRAVAGVLERELEALDFETEWIDLPPEMNRAGHLFARREGNRGRRLLLIGHLDTVFEPSDAFQIFVRDGDWASGPGTDDMKSGDVIILYALKALESIGALDGTQIVVAYTGDEESPGRPLEVTRAPLIEAGRWADVALGCEAGARADGEEWVTVSRRSSSGWRLEVEGLQAHSSQIFSDEVGAGAIFEAARILAAFYDSVRGEEYLTFNAGSILGGTDVDYDWEATSGSSFGKTNVVPRRTVAHGGIRTLSDAQLERARSRMRAIVADSLPHTTATITFDDGYPAMAPTDGNRRLASELSDVNVDLGGRPMPELDPSRRGAADISFVAPFADSLDGLGAYGEGGHSPAERLDLSSLPIAVKRAAILIYRLTR
jgi:glutamate carboxypeptidase